MMIMVIKNYIESNKQKSKKIRGGKYNKVFKNDCSENLLHKGSSNLSVDKIYC